MDNLEQKIARTLAEIESEHFVAETNLIYDYRTSLEHEHRFDHLPTAEEIALRLPNPCGWGGGMEDSVINGGVALDMYIDRGNSVMARKIFTGLAGCAAIAGVPGFVARSISPRDGKSFYPESSRDQYTHFVYGLWEYFNSPLAGAEEKKEISGLLAEVAGFCEEHVTEANGWTLPRADFGTPRSSVCKLWHVAPHEAARLPMFYAAAWAVTGDSHWFDMYRRYASEAAEACNNLGCRSYHSYALLQMMCSCRLIYAVEPDAALGAGYARAMELLDSYLNFNLLRAADTAYTVNYQAPPPDWRVNSRAIVIPGCRHVIPDMPEAYKLAARNIRETGEILLVRLMRPEPRLSGLDRRIFRFVLDGFEPETYCSYGGLYLAAAWSKAQKLGIEI